jgi:hypothetical protein
MRKLFFLIPAMLLAMMANATIFEIDPGYNPDYESTTGNIQHTIGSNITAAGDTIVLRDGIYVENYSINIEKPVVIMADKGARPIVQAASYFSVRANTKVIGVTFIGTGEYAFHVNNSTPKSLVFEDCEFTGYSKYVITGSSSKTDLDSCVINNCYFHDNGRGAVQFESSSSREDGQNSCEYLKVTNTTITNISALNGSVIDLRNKGNVIEGTDSLLVDHVTIYNWTGGSNGAIMGYKTKHIGIYNTIIAQPSSGSYDVYCYGGYVKNILTNNTTHKDWNPLPTFVNDMTGDPLFVDAANGNYALSATSPAIGAAIDGSNLGDPRWNAPSEYTSTDFSTPYAFTGDKAGVGGNVWRHEDGYLYYSDKSVCGTAIWGIHATRACAVEAQLNMNAATTTGHKFKVVLIDAKGNRLDSVAENSQTSDAGNINLKGLMYFPKEGDYFVKLYNLTGYSSSKINGVTLSYAGGAVQNISTTVNTTLPIADAWYKGCTRTDGYIQYPSSGTADAWMKWNIATSETKYYDLTVNVNTEYAHGFTVAVYEDEDAEPVASVTEGSYVNTKGTLALEIGRINLAGGKNYVVMVTNAPSGSQAKVLDVVFDPVVATATSLPGTLEFNNAVLSPNAHVTNSMLYFNEIGDTNPQGEWAQWEVTTDHDGAFLFTMGVESTNGQSYKITILDGENHTIAVKEQDLSSGTKTMKHFFELAAGNYFVKVENTKSYSKGHLTSLTVTEPDILPIDENATTNTVIVDNYRTGAMPIRINRTIIPGMYNTICLPFDVDDNQLKSVFGDNIELLQMSGATIDGAVLTLDFEPTSSIYRGTPYLIKTAAEVVNPIFTDVEIKEKVGQTTDGTDAEFQGIFIQTTLDADRDLFVGQNNTVHFPSNNNPLKGLRAYFHVTAASAQAIKRARIVTREEVITEIDLVNGENNGVIKTIENGQLIINLDGIRFNVMGNKIQ